MIQPIPTVRPFASNEGPTYRQLRLLALAESPDAFGSTLAAEQVFSDEQWSARLARGTSSKLEVPLVAEVNSSPVGLAWAKIEPPDLRVAHLYHLWVAPEFRGLGVGRMLLHAAIDWAKASDAQAIVLEATRGDTPANRLYASAGFTLVGVPQPLRHGSSLLEHTMRLELNDCAA